MEPVETNIATEQELLEKLSLLRFVAQCKQIGWDKLLEKYGMTIPEVNVGSDVKRIEKVVALIKENIDWVLDEEEFKRFTDAVKKWSGGVSESHPELTDQAALWENSRNYLFPDGRIEIERLLRASNAGLLGDFGKAMLNYQTLLDQAKKRTADLIEKAKIIRREAAAQVDRGETASLMKNIMRDTFGNSYPTAYHPNMFSNYPTDLGAYHPNMFSNYPFLGHTKEFRLF